MIDKEIADFVKFIKSKNGIGNKTVLINEVRKKFKLTKDRSVYYSKSFCVRFSYSATAGFSNTVISLSCLQKYDSLPFLVCLVTRGENILYIANTTFLQKVSHSSQEFRVDNIRGSINGSDIAKEFEGLKNSPENFEKLFNIHEELGFDGNLIRLVEATNNISPSGIKFNVLPISTNMINLEPERAAKFIKSADYSELKIELDKKVQKYKTEILIAGFIENVNIRGRIIEYLIAGEDKKMRKELITALHTKNKIIPGFQTQNDLWDYVKVFKKYNTATDIKTKIMVLSSNPKGYNIDKLLEFLSKEKSVFMFYFIGIEPNKITNQILVSMFQQDLLKSTILLRHWAGRNSRGVTQFEGETIRKLIMSPNKNKIDVNKSKMFLKTLIEL